MRVLLDTNIIIHREAYKVSHLSIGQLFRWLDELKYTKYIHPITEAEIKSHANQDTVKVMGIKMESYNTFKTIAPVNKRIQAIIDTEDKTQNDINDSLLLNVVLEDRVDIFITEDRKIHRKAAAIGVADRVFTISRFVEKCMNEHPELVNYKVLSIQKVYFGNINVDDSFFDSFKNDYPGFDSWFRRKSEEVMSVPRGFSKITLEQLYLILKESKSDESLIVN